MQTSCFVKKIFHKVFWEGRVTALTPHTFVHLNSPSCWRAQRSKWSDRRDRLSVPGMPAVIPLLTPTPSLHDPGQPVHDPWSDTCPIFSEPFGTEPRPRSRARGHSALPSPPDLPSQPSGHAAPPWLWGRPLLITGAVSLGISANIVRPCQEIPVRLIAGRGVRIHKWLQDLMLSLLRIRRLCCHCIFNYFDYGFLNFQHTAKVWTAGLWLWFSLRQALVLNSDESQAEHSAEPLELPDGAQDEIPGNNLKIKVEPNGWIILYALKSKLSVEITSVFIVDSNFCISLC